MSRSLSYPSPRDLGIVALSLFVAFILAYSNAIETLIAAAEGMQSFGSLIAGMFYTSVFTTAPATVALGKIALSNSVLETAFFGGLGALLGDFIIFQFVSDSISPYFAALVRKAHLGKFSRIFSRRPFQWVPVAVGALILASPLPDEAGLVLLGLSKTKKELFVPISFFANFFGILAIGIIARSIL